MFIVQGRVRRVGPEINHAHLCTLPVISVSCEGRRGVGGLSVITNSTARSEKTKIGSALSGALVSTLVGLAASNLGIVVICNLIWYYRNKCIFEQARADPYQVILSSNVILQDYHRVECHPEVISPLLSTPFPAFPPPNCSTICFDGSVSIQENCVGVGVALINAAGSFQMGVSKKFRNYVDPEVAEFLALREALKLAREYTSDVFAIFGDAANVVLAANEEAHGPSNCAVILEEILQLKSLLTLRGIFWFRRSSNFIAHSLALYAKNMNSDERIWNCLPDPLCQSLLDDFQRL
ncbi:hypothetical protein DH2020_001443 [Rehmannia glutinosa]|uniref:RNase H type-1 domain-containing protein n=1 Tax=Rehmannia glutinosa TaxID=99300 RepID=A0ABR0Y026_REHGL